MGNLKDFATGIVATAPSPANSGTSLTLQSGEGSRMPAVPFSATAHPAQEFPTLDNAEKIIVTNVTGDVLTITRAQGDTTAKSIQTGWRLSNALFTDDIPLSLSDLSDDSTHRLVTDTEKSTWSGKQDALGFTPEDVANKDTTTTLGESDTKYPSQKAVKTYVDNLTTMTQVRGETPSGTIDGSNVTFTLASTPATGSERLYKNGVRLRSGAGNDYTISGATITMTTAPDTGSILLADYEVSSGTFAQGVSNFITNEIPTGIVNGSNTSFTTAHSFIAGTLQVYINGLKQKNGTHFTETTPGSGIFTMSDAPLAGDILEVAYQHQLSSVGDADTLDGYHANSTPTAGNILPLDNDAMIPTSALGGAWKSWTPTWTNLTIGNATQVARYSQIGKTINAYVKLTLGSTSSMGTAPYFTLPVSASSNMVPSTGFIAIGTTTQNAAGIVTEGRIYLQSTGTALPVVCNVSNTYMTDNGFTSSVPGVWASTNYINIFVTYEAA